MQTAKSGRLDCNTQDNWKQRVELPPHMSLALQLTSCPHVKPQTIALNGSKRPLVQLSSLWLCLRLCLNPKNAEGEFEAHPAKLDYSCHLQNFSHVHISRHTVHFPKCRWISLPKSSYVKSNRT